MRVRFIRHATFEFGPLSRRDTKTTTAEDVIRTCNALPGAQVVAGHVEAINHCLLTRDELKDALDREGLTGWVGIPADGETLEVP